MITEKHIEVIKKAIKIYGSTNQFLVCIEEISELIKEITKTARVDNEYTENNYTGMIDELADVYIIYYQLLIILGNENFDSTTEDEKMLLFSCEKTILVNYLMFLMSIIHDLSMFMFDDTSADEEKISKTKELLVEKARYGIKFHINVVDSISNKSIVRDRINFKIGRLSDKIEKRGGPK